MVKKHKRGLQIWIAIFTIILISCSLGWLLYHFCIEKPERTLLFKILGYAGIGVIAIIDLCIFVKMAQKRKKKMHSIAKRRTLKHAVTEKDAVKSHAMPFAEKRKTFERTPKVHGGKSLVKQQIDLNIRPIDEKEFDIAQNSISTASSIILGTRKEQQDALYVSDTTFFGENETADAFGIVCDGMGGLANGGEASKRAVKTIVSLYAKARPVADVDIFFMDAIRKAHEEVQTLSHASADGKNAGTTLVAAIVQNDKLYTAAVGDSRIYIIRNGQIKMLTRDHNYYLLLKEQVKNGEITEQEMNMSTQKEALISYLGMPELKLVDIMSSPLQLVDGDVILLCSDGLTKALTKEEICMMITENAENLQGCAEMLTAAAQRKSPRGLDNTSVILLKYN